MTRFQDLCGALVASGVYIAEEEPAAPAEENFDAAGAARLLRQATHRLPLPYRRRFVRPLGANMPHVMGKLRRENVVGLTLADSPSWRAVVALDYATMLIGSVTDWDKPGFKPSLPALQGAVASIWRGAADRLTTAGIGLRTDLPPLVNYSARRDIGVHTDQLDRIRQFFPPIGQNGMIGGIVGLPAGYVARPPVWATLTHEVMGHALVHALPGVPGQPDESRVVNELRDALVTQSTMSGFWRECWSAWIEEAIADVCALLGQGPASMLSLAAQVSAAAEARAREHDEYVPVVRRGELESNIRMGAGKVATEHPPIVLRIHLALGVLDALGRMWGPRDPRTRELPAWRTLLGDIAAQATAGQTHARVVANGSSALLLRFEMADVVAMARGLGAGIAATRLRNLNGQSLAALLAYSAQDIAAIAIIRAQAARPGASLTGTANQLLAGATMALYDHPAAMDVISRNILPALDTLYRNDPVFP